MTDGVGEEWKVREVEMEKWGEQEWEVKDVEVEKGEVWVGEEVERVE